MFLLAENRQTMNEVPWLEKRVIFSAMGSLEKWGTQIYVLVRFNSSTFEYFLSKLLFLLISVAFRLNLWLNLFLWITNSFLMYIYIFLLINQRAFLETVRLCVCMCENTHKGVRIYVATWSSVTKRISTTIPKTILHICSIFFIFSIFKN